MKIKLIVMLALIMVFWNGVCVASQIYTVELKKFQALPSAKAFLKSLPPPVADQAFFTHSGIIYRVCFGKSEKKDSLVSLLPSLKGFNTTPAIIQINSSDILNSANKMAKEIHPIIPIMPKAPAPPARVIVQKTARPKVKKKRRYADLRTRAVKKYLAGNKMLVMPESATKIFLSNRDINRLTCSNGPVKDIVYSKEKGITVKTEGDNAFVKFLVSRSPVDGSLLYADTTSEFYVVCGDNSVYTLIASPKDIPAQTVRLVSSVKRIKKTISLFKGLPFEKKILKLVKVVYLDKIPESLTVKPINRHLNQLFRNMDITLQREVMADGEGLLLKEYVLSLKVTSQKKKMRLKEQFFLLPEITENPVGISLEHLTLKKGQLLRLFVVEKQNV